ncbi:methyltransferase domain-containing protein [Waterburya agarophytonicola K14]|uniref:Methyltransferase domain-containing protein n=1 Tax=Waterburya agarophytonicola KI4 TaxID=2874699 RepID=A0A964BQA0_9CYAN|nr:glycosyltransferase [Waterburya agarophytonicola]MCC0176872.1 methyltransferase domain-containing protein [Waterburya agarophytonicola KI4]
MSNPQQKDLDFWKKKVQSEGGKLKNYWYARLFTNQFEISTGFYKDKRVLDIGCGPRGTLEWADMVKERIGLDRYADRYSELGTDKQEMEYISAWAESIPLEDNSFDVVSAFNSLEYMSDISAAFQEIYRVLKPGGVCLLLCDITLDYQQKKSLDSPTQFLESLQQNWETIEAKYYEKKSSGIYQCIDDGIEYDLQDTSQRGFIASVLFCKPNEVQNVVVSSPKVSVIVPVRENICYLWQTIESILKQTYTNYEILVIDRGLDSRISQRLKPYNNQIKYLHQKDLDFVAALNYAVSKAKGEFIAFLDTDNFWTREDRLSRQMHRFTVQSTLGLLHSGWSIVDDRDRNIIHLQPWEKVPELNLEAWLQYQYVDLNALIVSAKWLQRVNAFDEQLKTFYGLDLVLRLSLAGCKSSWLKQVTTTNRKNINSNENEDPQASKNLLDILNRFFNNPDIPEHIGQIESSVRYASIVQIAWDSYERDNIPLAIEYLSQSRQFSPYLRVETISDWIDRFNCLSQESNSEFDVDSLCDLNEWKNLEHNWISSYSP